MTPTPPTRWRTQAQASLDAGDPPAAITSLLEYLSAIPEDAAALVLLGDCYLGLGAGACAHASYVLAQRFGAQVATRLRVAEMSEEHGAPGDWLQTSGLPHNARSLFERICPLPDASAEHCPPTPTAEQAQHLMQRVLQGADPSGEVRLRYADVMRSLPPLFELAASRAVTEGTPGRAVTLRALIKDLSAPASN